MTKQILLARLADQIDRVNYLALAALMACETVGGEEGKALQSLLGLVKGGVDEASQMLDTLDEEKAA